MKLFLAVMAVTFSLPALATEPARRPQGPAPTTIPAKALCRDRTYDCMYNCEVKEGTVCQPTRNSDPNCPAKQVTGGSWVNKKLVILYFGSTGSMSCAVTAPARSNLVCGDTKFGWDCWIGKMHNL